MQNNKKNRASNVADMQPMESVTNLKYAQPSFIEMIPTSFESDSTNINQSRVTKELRIGMQIDKSGLPSYVRSQITSKIKLIPLFLFSLFGQFHILYLIVLTGIKPLESLCFDGYSWNIFTLQCLLTVICISVECLGRYIMIRSLTKFQANQKTEYEIWKNQAKKWQRIEEKEIKVGQILKIEKKQRNLITENDSGESSQIEKKVRVSVNMLPIRCSSGKNYIQIDTFDMNKQEERIPVKIDNRFNSYFKDSHNSSIDQHQNIDYSIRNCKISYFFSHIGNQQFQALLNFQNMRQQKKITSSDIIPNGAYFCDEDYVIGVVLYSLERQRLTYLRYMIEQKNRIKINLNIHLFKVLMWICIAAVGLLTLNTILSGIIFNSLTLQSYHCYTFNYLATFSFSMNAIMYILLSLHHLWDSYSISRKCHIKVNNYIKTIDQFGMADAFVMDQFTLLKKNILAVNEIDTNPQRELEEFNINMILYLISNSEQFKRRFPKQWLSLAFHYKQIMKQKERQHKKISQIIKIYDEIIDISGAVRIIVALKSGGIRDNPRYFIIRFNQRIIFSILESINLENKQKFADKIEEGKKNGELMIMTEILQLGDTYEIDLSINTYELQYEFHSLIRMKFIRDRTGTDFVRRIKNKYNIVIMTSSPLEYFDQVLVTTGLKDQNSMTLVFEQAEETVFEKDLQHRISEIKNFSLQNYSGETLNHHKHLIIALDSSLIVYLAQQKARKLLRQISEHATYLIFYNTSQFQKQLCATNIFKIFPNHIYLSNFAVDAIIFRLSNLSVSIYDHSANRFTTICAKNYNQLCKFIMKQSPASMQLTSLIIKNHIFKNQCLIGSMVLAMFLFYKGTYFYLNTEYSTYNFFIFNAGFTLFPLIYYFIKRPRTLEGIIIDSFNIDMNLNSIHFLGFFLGMLTTFTSYTFISENMAGQLFVNILVNCVLMGNLYYLVLDNSVHKKGQNIVILLQCLFSIGIIFISQYIPSVPHNLFTFAIRMSPLNGDQVIYFIGTYIFNIFLIILIFFYMAITKQIKNREIKLKNKINKQENESQINEKDNSKRVLRGKVARSSGKQMRFRGSNARSNIY